MSESNDPNPELEKAEEQFDPNYKRKRYRRSRRTAAKVKPSLKKKKKTNQLFFVMLGLVILAIGYVSFVQILRGGDASRSDLVVQSAIILETTKEVLKKAEVERRQAEVDRLFGVILQSKAMLKAGVSIRIKRELLDKRMKAAEDLLGMSLTETDRFAASREYGDSVLEMYSNGFFSDSKLRLQLFCDKLLDDADIAHVQLGKFSLTRLALVDFLKKPEIGFESSMQAITRLVEEYPSHGPLAREMLAFVNQLVRLEHPDEAIQLIDFLLTSYSKSSDDTDDQIRQAHLQLVDLKILLESGFGDHVTSVKDEKEGAIEDVLDAVEKLCDHSTITIRIAQRISYSLRFLEGHHRYEAIRRIIDLLQARLSNHPDQTIVDFVSKDTALISKRLQWIGREFEIMADGRDAAKFNDEEIKGKVTAVIFWSVDKTEEAMLTFAGINLMYASLRKDGFSVIAVNVDDDDEKARNIVNPARLTYPTVFEGSSDREDMATVREKYGLQFTPYVMLLDRNGRVAQLNMIPANMKREVDRLLAQEQDSK